MCVAKGGCRVVANCSCVLIAAVAIEQTSRDLRCFVVSSRFEIQARKLELLRARSRAVVDDDFKGRNLWCEIFLCDDGEGTGQHQAHSEGDFRPHGDLSELKWEFSCCCNLPFR